MSKHEDTPPPPCSPDIYKYGSQVACYAAGMVVMEGLVKEACRNGLEMDWHYVGGIAVVRTLETDIEKCRKALQDAMPILMG